jgi:hypothetical protein
MKFITDAGESKVVWVGEDGRKHSIPRYGVWGEKGKGKPEVIETSDDLEYLQTTHGPGLEVHSLPVR